MYGLQCNDDSHKCEQLSWNVIIVKTNVLQLRVHHPLVQVRVPEVQVRVRILKMCTRVQLEYEYKYQVLHLCMSVMRRLWASEYGVHTIWHLIPETSLNLNLC